ncbi:MAG TPA: hypothetical protein VK427_08035 [Kofleriaceae bacterium]|nr:hypothetical protein [Kofleriaceae bacterium]
MRAILLAILVAACGGGSDAAPDATVPADASPTCLVPAAYGNLGGKTGTTAQGPTTMTIVLDPGPPRDSFFLKLNNVAPGTYALVGAELSQATCKVCVNIIADIVTMQGPSKFYFATGGSVTLTATSPPAGTLSDVTFHEVTVDGTPTGSGCTTKIDALQFSGT